MGRLAWRVTLWSIPLFWFVLRIMFVVLWRVASGAFLLAVAGIVGLGRGIPESTQLMAADWSDIMRRWGMPLPTVERLNPVLRVWGFLLLFMGWAVIGLVIGIVILWVT